MRSGRIEKERDRIRNNYISQQQHRETTSGVNSMH